MRNVIICSPLRGRDASERHAFEHGGAGGIPRTYKREEITLGCKTQTITTFGKRP